LISSNHWRVDHGAQRGKLSTPFERRPPVLIEELVVDVELSVNIGGIEDGDVLCSSLQSSLAAEDVNEISTTLDEMPEQDQARVATQAICVRNSRRVHIINLGRSS
jgi:hypothetical protein